MTHIIHAPQQYRLPASEAVTRTIRQQTVKYDIERSNILAKGRKWWLVDKQLWNGQKMSYLYFWCGPSNNASKRFPLELCPIPTVSCILLFSYPTRTLPRLRQLWKCNSLIVKKPKIYSGNMTLKCCIAMQCNTNYCMNIERYHY